MNNHPLVSILVTVFNGMPYMKDAMESLLDQTYKNIEIIVVDDQSTDDSLQYLNSIKDERLKVFVNETKGRGRALNFGLEKCKGKYVAINDADDISMLDRIEKQVDFLENHTDHGLVGAHSYLYDYENDTKMMHHRPLDDAKIRFALTRGQPIQHVTVLIRKDVLDRVGGYNEKIKFLFDRDLFLRIGRVSKMANLQEVLIIVGHHDGRFFYHQFKGFEREWLSLKYRIRAIIWYKFPWYYILREIAFSLYSFLPAGLRLKLVKLVKKIRIIFKTS